MNKIYYELLMTAKSPLCIGGAGSENSDTDLLLNGRGMPFIPGSSLAGVLRDWLKSTADQKEIFGDVEIATDEKNIPKASPSLVLVSDAELVDCKNEDDILISVRDGVGLDEWGMAVPGAKYDFEIAEVKGKFRSVLECDFVDSSQMEKMESILSAAVAEGIHLGARTSRGYGYMECEVRKIVFEFPQDITEWLKFRPFDMHSFDGNEKAVELNAAASVSDRKIINIHFRLDGCLTIRVREANAVVREDGTNPDSVTIKNQDRKPVIPGTAWAGTFRHHMLEINRELGKKINEGEINRLFGKGPNGNDSTKSKLYFSESEISGGRSVVMMRNSVDRFTAAPTNGALFTTEAWHGGEGSLTISYENGSLSVLEESLLAEAITDLSNGLMTVGGIASAGNGTIKIDTVTVNGTDKQTELENYSLKL